MRDQTTFRTDRHSRRDLLVLAGGATTAALLGPMNSLARQGPAATPAPGPVGTPAADAAAAPTQPMPGTLDADASPLFRSVAGALADAMVQFQVPGAAIGLLAGDREEHATFGLASRSSLRPVTSETLFQIGSITKTCTATAIWRLIDAGALDLDAPVRTYLPDLTLMDAEVAEQVTVRNLLDHTAGWYGDEGFDSGEDDNAIARYVSERLPQLPQIFPLGAFFSYNNAAFTVLGRLIEVATGTSYNAAMHNLLIDPLGLDQTFLDHDAVLERPYADGHAALPINGRQSVAVQAPLWVPRSVDPAGGIWSTTRDLLRYARFHLGEGTVAGAANVVAPDSLARMQEPSADMPGLSMQIGMNWFVQNVDGVPVIHHGGDTLGQHADLVIFPEHNVVLAVLTNGQGGGSRAASSALDAALAGIPDLSSLVGKVGLLPVLTAGTGGPMVDLSSTERAEYAGRFADPGQALTIAEGAEGLEVTLETIEQPGTFQPSIVPPAPPSVPVAVLAPDLLVIGGQRMPLIRDEDGRIGWISVGLRLLPRVDGEA